MSPVQGRNASKLKCIRSWVFALLGSGRNPTVLDISCLNRLAGGERCDCATPGIQLTSVPNPGRLAAVDGRHGVSTSEAAGKRLCSAIMRVGAHATFPHRYS
jgi:hypothetical protein